ncbi:hypothetical protein RDABS01_027375 [Bienertia sinuspersici]
MDYHFSSSIFDPLCPQINELFHNNIPDYIPLTQLQVEGDQILPIFEEKDELHDDIFNQMPTFTKDPPRKTDQIVQPKKRSLETSLRGVNQDQENEEKSNERKKKQKMLHKEVERQRRLEMSSLHTSLKSLLPLEYTKGKRSITDHLEETVKYINEMQRKMQVLIDQRDGLRKEVLTFKKQEHDVIVNVFKGCLEVIVSTTYGDDGEQGLPLSKVLQCLVKEGLDVVNSISKRVNNNIVHSIHAQVANLESKGNSNSTG